MLWPDSHRHARRDFFRGRHAYILAVLLRSSFIRPMVPRLVSSPPAGPDWLHEVKFDGFRAQVHLENGAVTIYSRNGIDFTQRFRQLIAPLGALPCRSAIIDGEMIACDSDGKPDFAALMRKGARPPLCLVAFDLLELDGASLLAEPMEMRRATLTRLLRGIGGVVLVEMNEHACLQAGWR